MGVVTEMTAALTMQVQLHQGKIVGEIAWCSGGTRDHQRGAPRVGKAIVMTGTELTFLGRCHTTEGLQEVIAELDRK